MRTKLDAVSITAVLVTVGAFSATAPLTAFATGSALALALGRNALGLLTLGPVVALIRRREFRKVFRGERFLVRKEQRRGALLGTLAGTALAAHFATFMSSTRMTSVAMATALVATQPVWQALISTLQGHRLPHATWAGLGISVAGAAIASGMDGRAPKPSSVTRSPSRARSPSPATQLSANRPAPMSARWCTRCCAPRCARWNC